VRKRFSQLFRSVVRFNAKRSKALTYAIAEGREKGKAAADAELKQTEEPLTFPTENTFENPFGNDE